MVSPRDFASWATTDLNIATPRWQLHVPGVRMMGAWTTNAFFAVNDVVSYGANQFLCISNHTSAANENLFYANDGYLSVSPKWSLFTEGTRYVADWTSGTWYKLNDIVKYGNTLYLTTVAHTSGIQFDVTLNDNEISIIENGIVSTIPDINIYSKIYNVGNYHKRNKDLVEYSDNIVAFCTEGKVTNGTGSALKYSKKIDKKVIIFD